MAAPVLVFTPFPIDSLQGNSVSARRIASLLVAAGVPARAVDSIPPAESLPHPAALISLHACRSVDAMREFAERFPGLPRHLVLTGSDLYRCLPDGDPRPLPMMEEADTLIVAQEASLADIPAPVREKARLIPKSLDVEVPRWSPPAARSPLEVVVVAHLRAQKNPFLPVRALARIPELEIRIRHFGAESQEGFAEKAQAESRIEPRYCWMGATTREGAIAEVSKAHLLLNSSLMEGGANSLCEALHIGAPILATRIPGNIGMLGEDHPGLFEKEEDRALSQLLRKAHEEEGFLEELARHSRERSTIFTREAEMRGWVELVGPAD